MLAARDITVSIGGGNIRLRPTLRAALRLEREHGLALLFARLAEGSVTATTAILAEHADPIPAVSVADAISLAPTLADHLGQLVDFGEQPKAKGKASGKPVSLGDQFARLYALGTGVLGWTPEATWNASPLEILSAHSGRIEFVDQLLTAVFGGKDASRDDSLPTPEERKRGIETLRALG